MTQRWQIRSVEAEKNIVGGILVHSRVFGDIVGLLDAEDFTELPHVVLWRAFEKLDTQRIPIDAVSTWQMVGHMGDGAKLQRLGGPDYLTHLMSEVVTVENIGYHAAIVAKLAQRRRWERELREMLVRAGDETVETDELLADNEARFLRLSMQHRSASTSLGSKEGMKQLVRELERRFEQKDNPIARGVPTGFHYLDHLTSGFHPGQLIVVVARPRVGKSTFLSNVVEYNARKKIPSLIFSPEMQALEIYERMIAANGVRSDALRTGHLSPDDFKRLMIAASEINDPERITVDDEGDITITELRSRARRWRARDGAGKHAMVGVDYLQLVQSGRRRRSNGDDVSRQEEVAEVSRGLKQLAKELACPVVALAQPTREVDKRQNQRLKLADIRESGAIEQDADVVLGIYREEIADPECAAEHKGTAEIDILKGRGLAQDRVHLRFEGHHNRFLNPKAA